MSIRLTEEQENILDTLDNEQKYVIINALSGTGKTSTTIKLIEKILDENPDAKILYTCFNTIILNEGKEKFKKLGLKVESRTAHSLALGELKKIRNVEVIQYLDYEFFKKNKKDRKSTFIGVKHLIDEYCHSNSNMENFKKEAFNSWYNDEDKTPYVEEDIEDFEVIYNKLMDEDKFLHEMYLKEYALLSMVIDRFDYVFIDEAQDLDRSMLSIIRKLDVKKIYLFGDVNQNIYSSFRNTVNALDILRENQGGNVYPLTKSFRFHDDIAKIANSILVDRKGSTVSLKGNGPRRDIAIDMTKKTVLFRSNFGILTWACALLRVERNAKIKFNGIVNGKSTKTFVELFYDFISLLKLMAQEKRDRYFESELDTHFYISVPSPKVLKMKKIAKEEKESLISYLRFQCDKNVSLDQDLVNYFKFADSNWTNLISNLIMLEKAQFIKDPSNIYELYTTHKCKGMEYDNVIIAPDCWYNEDYARTDEKYKKEALNIIYTALTRAKENLTIESPIVRELCCIHEIEVNSVINFSDYIDDEDEEDNPSIISNTNKNKWLLYEDFCRDKAIGIL